MSKGTNVLHGSNKMEKSSLERHFSNKNICHEIGLRSSRSWAVIFAEAFPDPICFALMLAPRPAPRRHLLDICWKRNWITSKNDSWRTILSPRSMYLWWRISHKNEIENLNLTTLIEGIFQNYFMILMMLQHFKKHLLLNMP